MPESLDRTQGIAHSDKWKCTLAEKKECLNE